MKLPVSVIIPAAGCSSRMGSSKAQLEYLPGMSFAGHLTGAYSGIGSNPVVMVINERTGISSGEFPGVILVMNDRLDLGRQHSIRLALEQVPDNAACFLHNIDNPYAETGLLIAMLDMVEKEGFVVPVWNGMSGHPVLLGENVIKRLKSAETFEDLREELSRFKKIELPWPDERICTNINTREDYLQFKAQNSTPQSSPPPSQPYQSRYRK